LVNAAYEVETGSEGVAFKNITRYNDVFEPIEDELPFFHVLRLENSPKIVGVVKAKMIDDFKIVEIGPVAIRPEFQVNKAVVYHEIPVHNKNYIFAGTRARVSSVQFCRISGLHCSNQGCLVQIGLVSNLPEKRIPRII